MSSEYGMMDLPSEDTATEFEDDDKINPILNATEPTDELQRRDTNHRRKESEIGTPASPLFTFQARVLTRLLLSFLQ